MAFKNKEKSDPEILRLFVAYPFPKGLWKDVEKIHINNAGITNLRCTPLRNLHVTILFIGEVHAYNLERIKDKIRDEISVSSPFNLTFEKVSMEARRRSGMMWLRFLKDENFSSLSKKLKESLGEFMLHSVIIHDLIAHVTIARWKEALEIEKINVEFNPGFLLPEINFCELWQSVQTPAGVKYESLERFEMEK